MKLCVALCVAVLGFCQAAVPAPVERPTEKQHPVRVDLVADVAAIRPGSAFTLGVRLRMQPEWHVYWKNPGDAGLPVMVKFTGPEGMTFSAIEWPVPIRFEQPGEISGYGYTDTVVFPVDVQAPANLPIGSSVRIVADASWLVCRDVCIPGKATADLTLPAGETAPPSNGELIAEWRGKLPIREAAGLATVKTEGGITGKAGKNSLAINVEWKAKPSKVEFFPTAQEALALDRVSVSTEGNRTRITFEAEILSGLELSSDKLETLVVHTDTNGNRRGITVLVPLRAGNEIKER